MARRRREVSSDPAIPGESTPAAEGPEPQATLTVRGSADAVKKQLGVGSEKLEPEKKKEGNGRDDEKQKFVESLRNPQYLVRVKRQSPREMAGHCWDEECPITYTKIQDETKRGWGGGSFRAVIMDPDSNKTIAADTFDIPGDPIIPESDMSQEEQERMFMNGRQKSAADLTEEGLERRARVSAKMLEVEALEGQLEEARKRRESGGKPAPQDNTRVDDLERRLTEAKHQAELEARDRKHAEEIRQLRELIEKSSRPAKQEGSSEIGLLIQQMQKNQESSDKRFESLQKQMQDDKMNLLLQKVESLERKPAAKSGSLLEDAEAILKLKKVFGWGSDDDDDDEEDDKDDDRPWWERAIDKLGGKFGDKFLDKLMEKFEGMEGKGEPVTREQFIKDLQDEAQRIADAAVEQAKRKNLPPLAAPNPALPAPPPPPPSSPAVTIPAPQATALPPPPPPSMAPATITAGSSVAVPAAEAPPKLTLEQEIVLRVGGVLEILEREIELRPHEYHWNYEGAYCSLPESILEKVCAAPDPVAMVDAFAIPHINPDNLAEMKAKISGNPKILAWVKAGHDELKTWFAEKQKDPAFDPFADEEEEEGEEE